MIEKSNCKEHTPGHRRNSIVSELSQKKLKKLFYKPIVQRHQWGDHQVMPHIKWVTLFHDLFFVGMAYNLGNLVLGAWASGYSVLYFIGLYFPCANIWHMKMYFEARFKAGPNLYHQLLLIIELCLLATAVVHIDELNVMRTPSKYANMFAFCLAMSLIVLLSRFRCLEVYLSPCARSEARHSVKTDTIHALVPFSCYLAAAIVSGYAYFHKDSEDDRRFLAEKDEVHEKSFNDLPIFLLYVGFLSYQFISFLQVVILFPKDGSHKKYIAPMNVEYSIHRHGEWIMLMLGEAVLSLLIVHVPSGNGGYYFTFFCSIVSTVTMQYLHFQSEPHQPENHAVRRHKDAGMIYTICTHYYSAALVAIGFSLKMMLTLFSVVETSSLVDSETHESSRRNLAGGGVEEISSIEMESRKNNVVNFFCISMVLSLLLLDLMTLAHKGIKANASRINGSCGSLESLAVAFVKMIAIVFIGLIGLFTNEPEYVTGIGLVLLFVNVTCRILLDVLFDMDAEISEHEEETA